MPESNLIKDLIDNADNEFLKAIAEIYFALPVDTPDSYTDAITEELEKLVEERANANCPN